MSGSNYNSDVTYTDFKEEYTPSNNGIDRYTTDSLSNYLANDVMDRYGWNAVKELVLQRKSNHSKNITSITQYHLYLILKQKQVPVPSQIITIILKAYPDLCDPDNKIYHLNVIVAFENTSSLPETLYQLIHQSRDPIKLTYMIMQQMIDRSSNTNIYNNHFINLFNHIPEENLQVLIHESLVQSLYHHDVDGNLLLHQACQAGNSPRMVRLIINGMIHDTGWCCVMGCNNDGLSPFQLALSCSSTQDANGILMELLSVIPLDLPSQDCIVRNDILHVSIRVGNWYLAFKILKEYPDLFHLWNSQGSLPLHDICQFGNAQGIEQFLTLYSDTVKSQMQFSTAAWTRFIPLQIACMNPLVTVNLFICLLHYLLDSNLEQNAEIYNSSVDQTVKQYGLLHLAAAASNVDIARYLISICPTALSYRRFQQFGLWGTEGPTPLFFACVSGSSEMIKCLFLAGKIHRIHPDKHAGLIDMYSGNNLHPIVAACSNSKMTTDTMEMLFLYSNIPCQWICDWKLLHSAAFEGNMEVALALVSWYPEGLFHIDGNGDLPLHDACMGGDPNMIEYLFIEQVKKVCFDGYLVIDDELCGMFKENYNGVTPWDLVCDILESIFEEYQDVYTHFSGLISAAMLALTLAAAMDHSKSDKKESSDASVSIPFSELNGTLNSLVHVTPFPVYHSAIQRISSISVLEYVVVQNLLNSHPLQLDRYGRTALHLVAEIQTEAEDWYEIIYHLLCDEEHGSQDCAYIQDNKSRYVLHTAAENGLGWSNGLELILNANEEVLECRDEVTGLFPYMLAASGERSDLDSIYELLRRNPGLPFPKK